MEFSPEVLRNGSAKYPDFLWKTSLGDIYCECKQVGEFEDKFTKRANAINAYVEKKLKDLNKDPDFRYDFVIEKPHQAEVSIDAVLNQIQNPSIAQKLNHLNVTLSLQPKGTPIPEGAVVLRTSNVSVGTTVTPLSTPSANSTVTILATSYWQRVSGKLIRDARSQLPQNSPGAVLLSLSSEAASKAAQIKIHELIGQGSYENTPWIAVWAQGGINMISRNGQPFDARLGEPIGMAP